MTRVASLRDEQSGRMYGQNVACLFRHKLMKTGMQINKTLELLFSAEASFGVSCKTIFPRNIASESVPSSIRPVLF